ncbi:histidinol-phosphate aminotransferase [Fusarium subglutinans]|uniref:histidinol-phosphate transaminase n=1 Tax=Gibberella subglutinans TaxID=42677 RepID=A0A8H5QDI9_GIBSU|nr:histidinol-phosphate aminotransferase [Fusarium subglutinans]KAF5613302.1 histidinol-phosphate aminotransferase [Fusarium subglutinans]
MRGNSPFDITKCARPNILALEPYTSERDDYPPGADITLLDANENAFGPSIDFNRSGSKSNGSKGEFATLNPTGANKAAGSEQPTVDPKGLQLHRYPDAHSMQLRQKFCDFRQVEGAKPLTVQNVCLTVGGDESIDIIIRVFCTPGKDKILICPPTYGMYEVSAHVNDVGIVKVNLDVDNGFTLRPDAINEVLSADPTIKVVFICSPGNPAGNLLERSDIVKVLEHPTWNGVVVVDEAYIDFAPEGSSFVTEVNTWHNLIVAHTMSKAFGLAAIRLGISYSQPQIARLMNNVRGPYNMSAPTVALASAALSPDGLCVMEENRTMMVQQRDRLLQELPKIPGFGRFLGDFHTNFVLAQFLDKPADQSGVPDNATATALKDSLATRGPILVRDRSKQIGCSGSLRITVGNMEQVDDLLIQIRTTLKEMYKARQ